MNEAEFMREQARECRRHAAQAEAQPDRRALQQLADHYEREARKLAGPRLEARH